MEPATLKVIRERSEDEAVSSHVFRQSVLYLLQAVEDRRRLLEYVDELENELITYRVEEQRRREELENVPW